MSYLIGIDTGGTFTDCVIMDEAGKVVAGKSASTPSDFSLGILDSVRVTAESMGLGLEEILKDSILFSHAATTATNAVVTRRGAKTGLITTAGFEDTILIMRIMGKYAGLGEAAIKRQIQREKPEPIVPKALIRGIHERVDYKGEIVVPMSDDAVREAVQSLVDAGVESIAVTFLWSPRNSSNEERVRDIINEMAPDIYVTISSDLCPLLGEYERTATSAINSFLGPLVSNYLTRLKGRMTDSGYPKPPLVAQAHGGCLGIEQAARQPVSMISSGPVAGVIGSQYLANLLGHESVITTDMGGTSFDVGLIYGGVAEPAIESIVAQYHLLIPMVAVESIGAGGGSIAWIEPSVGRLRIGPQSAGAEPGPVCYDAGGTEPTVTDADLVLGLLNPDNFLGGRRGLNKEKAYEAIKTKIADPLGMTVIEAAAGIHRIVNSHMSDLIRSVTVGKGYDPRKCVVFAYGGAGPVHAYAYGRDAEAIVVPASAAVHSAMGALASDIVRTYQLGSPMKVPVDVDRFNSVFSGLESRAVEDLKADGFKDEDATLTRYVDMRHMRQIHEVRVPCKSGILNAEDLERLNEDFEENYERLYGKGSAFREAGVEVISFTVEGRGKIIKPSLATEAIGSPDSAGAIKGKRDLVLNLKSITVDVYDYPRLHAGNVVDGPAVIETPITTVIIDSDQRASLDEFLNIIIRPKAA